jgi:YebC/PmpR family DNA-binding regulatory protein
MPADTIDRAIKRGTGELEGVTYDEITYEGYGPGGVAVMVEVTTDNRNRTVAEIRHAFSKHGGNMGESGSVGWMFNRKGQIIIDSSVKGEDEMMELALETGADDFQAEGESYQILTAPEDFHAVLDKLKAAGIEPMSAEVAMIPQNTISLEGGAAAQMMKLYDALDDHDDVQNVYTDLEVSDEDMQRIAAASS